MNKLFKPKCINRIIVFMALLAPIIYLFGTMGTYLVGAHGDIVLAQPVYVDEYIEIDSLSGEGSYRVDITSFRSFLSSDNFSYRSYTFDFVYNSNSYSRLYFDVSSDGSRRAWFDSTLTAAYNPSTSLYTGFSNGSIFTDDYDTSGLVFLAGLDVSTLYKLVSVPTSVVPDNNSANSDYLFGQMFPRDNFLAKVGQNALSDNPMGFAPFGWLLSYLDRNMLHMGASQIAQMGYGYFYWCAHVLLFDLVFYFAVFFIRFIKHLGDMFIKEE